jgi:osmotically-inducible protein OsmY
VITDVNIEGELRELFLLDQRISDPAAIAVSVDDGVVTLRGTVGSFGARRAAVRDARSIDGVEEVIDELKVRLLDEYQREDADIRGAALQNLMWDAEVPGDLIEVNVEDGWVTLRGDVFFQFQSDSAYDDVSRLYGVTGVTNAIVVTTP